MIHNLPKYWLGTEDSAEALASALAQVASGQTLRRMDEDQLPPLLHVQQGVGVISIQGPLVPGSAGIMAFFGVTGYDDIRTAVVSALENPEIKTLMLHVQSGGGAVNGVEDLGEFLALARQIKPLTTYAEGSMASAAYWLGSYGSHISTNRTAILGSLGVLAVHTEYVDRDAREGIKRTLVRAGEYKTLTNPYERLSKVGEAELQEQVDATYAVFLDVIAPNRGVSAAVADQKFGQGRVFMGADAVQVGLADALMTYEQALMHSKSLDKSLQTRNNPANPKGASAMKPTLSAAHLAAIASGASLDDLNLAAGDLAGVTPPVAAVPAAVVAPAIAASADAGSTVEATALVAAEAKATLLGSQLALAVVAKDAAITQAATLQAQLDSLTGTHAQLTDIARQATANMLIPFGGSADSVAQMSGADLIAKHAEASAIFKSKLVVGGALQTPKAEAKPARDPWQAALIAAGPQARKAAQSNSR